MPLMFDRNLPTALHRIEETRQKSKSLHVTQKRLKIFNLQGFVNQKSPRN